MDKLPKTAAFWGRVQQGDDDACWRWLGYVNRKIGYGSWTWRSGRTDYAHRLAWRLTFGEIPPHLQVDHLCRQSLCCNPRHMQLLDIAEHARKSTAERYGHIGSDLVCRHGHVGERYRKSSTGKIACRACARDYKRRRDAAHRKATRQAA